MPIIVGFNVKAESTAAAAAKREGVQIKLYSIIYELIDQVKEAMAGMLDPETRETVIGHAEVKKVFELSKGMVAGCLVTDGRIARTPALASCADGSRSTTAASPRCGAFTDDVKEVRNGLECGIKLGDFNDYEVGDIIECYNSKKFRRSCNAQSRAEGLRASERCPLRARSMRELTRRLSEPLTSTSIIVMKHRLERVNEVIKRELGDLILREITFEAKLVTVQQVDITPDLKHAHVFIGVIGTPEQRHAAMAQLHDKRRTLQHELSKRVVFKFTPQLHFKLR